MISYAQNYEDVMLERVFHNKSDGFYVDVGAWDPKVFSVTHHFYEKGWSGINIEPTPDQMARIQAARPRDINLQLAVSDQPGTLTLHQIEGDNCLSTLDATSEIVRNRAHTSHVVHTVTLADICRTFVHQPIDFMKIDVEGWEHPVIMGADWSVFRPTIVLVEATEPLTNKPSWESWDPILQNHGYLFCYFDNLNRFYIKQECRYLFPLFSVGPHCGDGFRRA